MTVRHKTPVKVKLKDLRENIEISQRKRTLINQLWSSLIAPRLFIATVIIPTVMTVVYYIVFSSNIYVSETKFVVRAPADNSGIGSLSNVIQSSSISKATDDAHAINSYLISRDAVQLLRREADFDKAYGPERGDFLARFPGLLKRSSDEARFKYFLSMAELKFDKATSITTLTVKAFDPHDAQRLSTRLLEAGEALANRLTQRMREDIVRSSNNDAQEARERAMATQRELTAWRQQEQQIDPTRFSNSMIEVIARMSLEAALLRAQSMEIQKSSPQSPMIASIDTRIASLSQQIEREKAALAGNDSSLADKIIEFERLQLERQFAEKMFSAAVTAQESARSEAQRQQIYVERIVSPSLSDYPKYPYRTINIIAVLIGSFLLYLSMARIILNIRRHGAFQQYFANTGAKP